MGMGNSHQQYVLGTESSSICYDNISTDLLSTSQLNVNLQHCSVQFAEHKITFSDTEVFFLLSVHMFSTIIRKIQSAFTNRFIGGLGNSKSRQCNGLSHAKVQRPILLKNLMHTPQYCT